MKKTMNAAAFLRCAVPAFAAALLGACAHEDAFEKQFGLDAPRAQIAAARTSEKITIDGDMKEDAWAKASVCKLQPAAGSFGIIIPPKTAAAYDAQPFEGAEVRLLYDDTHLYIGAKLKDPDVVQYGELDQTQLYTRGDVLEIFLKSEKSHKYWEFYAAPNGKRTTFVFHSRAYVSPGWGKADPSFRTAPKVLGTLNNYTDTDEGWTVEAAIPFKMLEELTGVKFGPEGKWTILLARYNYDFGQAQVQLSSAPQLPQNNFHLHEYYAELLLR